MLEWYCKNQNYCNIITQCQSLLSFIASQLNGDDSIRYQDSEHSFNKWQETKVTELFKDWAKIDLDSLDSWDDLMIIAKEKKLNQCQDSDEAFCALFAHYLDPHISKMSSGLVVKDYPNFQRSLAKKGKDPRYLERFEIYFAGLELANGYSELCDSNEMLFRYEQFIRWHNLHTQRHYQVDMEFIDSLSKIKEAAGVAMGIDRLLMLLINASSIDEVVLFPTKEIFGEILKQD